MARQRKQSASWSERIRAVMSQYDIGQVELASRLGVTQPLVSAWLNGKYEPNRCAQKLLTLMERGNNLENLDETS